MIASSQQLQTALQRITWCQNQASHLRKTQPNRTSYLQAASGLLAEIKLMQREVRDYFAAFQASRGFNMAPQDAIDLVRESLPTSEADAVVAQLLPSSQIVVHDDTASNTGATVSHFGGVPSVPRGMEWPVWDRGEYLAEDIRQFESRFQANPQAIGLGNIISRMRHELSQPIVPLLFLAQLSLAEVNAAAPLPDWPTEGSLAFFYDALTGGFGPLSRGHCQVFHFSNDEQLIPLQHPDGLSSKMRFPHRRLSFRRDWTLPSHLSLNGTAIWTNAEYKELCNALMFVTSEREPIHRCGGHPQEIQGIDMPSECHSIFNKLYCGDQTGDQDTRRPTLEKEADDWRLLIQIDSDEKRLGWMWGDVGRIYIWARRQDIKMNHFDRAWGILYDY